MPACLRTARWWDTFTGGVFRVSATSVTFRGPSRNRRMIRSRSGAARALSTRAHWVGWIGSFISSRFVGGDAAHHLHIVPHRPGVRYRGWRRAMSTSNDPRKPETEPPKLLDLPLGTGQTGKRIETDSL